MNATNGAKNAAPWMRVLGIDPAAAGPTGYGVVDSDGRNCRMLHYGALRVPAARQKESSGAALQDNHELGSRRHHFFSLTVIEGFPHPGATELQTLPRIPGRACSTPIDRPSCSGSTKI